MPAQTAHNFAAVWTNDATGHWYACQNTGCEVKNSFAAHTPSAEAVADCTQSINCTVCGYVIKAGGTHRPSLLLTVEAAGCWNACRNEGCEVKVNFGHTPGAAATCTADQVCTRTGCGTILTPRTGHNFDMTTWTLGSTTSGGNTTLWHVRPCLNGCNTTTAATDVHGNSNARGNCNTTGAANCTSSNSCSVCGRAGTGAGLGHDWDYSKYVKDANNHWWVCKRTGCTATTGVEAHNVLSWTITVPVVCGVSDGEQKGNCTDCGEVTKVIPKAHEYDPNSSFHFDPTGVYKGHYHICERCGAHPDAEDHTFNAAGECTNPLCGYVDCDIAGHVPGAAATCTTPQVCTICTNVLVAALGHTPGAAATCGAAQTCTVCSIVLAAATGAHTPGTAATCTTAQTCTVCSTVLAVATGHEWETDWTNDATGHWYVCENGCGTKGSEAIHNSGGAATHDDPEVCTVCGYEIAPAVGHTFEVILSSDATGHWYACTEPSCTEKNGFAAHDFGAADDEEFCLDCGYPNPDF